MQPPLKHIICRQTCWLSAGRTLYWEEESCLIASDLHFGKTGHFRKSSIAIPQQVYRRDLHRLFEQVQFFQPKKLLIVGDMFHSEDNLEISWFKKWRKDLPHLPIQLVMGNHDILHEDVYHQMNIEIIHETLTQKPFRLIHEYIPEQSIEDFVIAGHVHPGVVIRGAGKQSLHFPCFYITENYLLMPAFSNFTGTYTVQPGKNDHVFALLPADPKNGRGESILQIQ